MLRIIVAPDSFKESLSARQVAMYISEGIRQILPSAEIVQVPMSDGGEGLIDCLLAGREGHVVIEEVTGPLGNRVQAKMGIIGDNETAIIEMAEASGLALVPVEKRNPLIATSFGTGELMRRALDEGCRRLIVGIGGSATNDGGAGMAQALGIKLLNSRHREIGYGAQGLLELETIDMSNVHPRLKGTEILAACDVSNPLYGATGAAYVYGPQKGAMPEMLPVLDQALVRLAKVVERDLKLDVHDLPGSGAAGGLGAGLVALTGGHLRPGLELVFNALNFESILAEGADLLITGEGQINAQTCYGKVPFGVARLAKKYGIPVLALAGSIGPGSEDLYGAGIDAMMSIVPGPVELEEAMARAGEMVREASSRAMRMLLLFTSREKH